MEARTHRLVHSFDFRYARSAASRLDELARDDAAIASRVASEYPVSSALPWIAGTGVLLIFVALGLPLASPFSPALAMLMIACALPGSFLLLITVRVTQVIRFQRARLTRALRNRRQGRLNRRVIESMTNDIRLYGADGPTNREFALLLFRGTPLKGAALAP